MGACTVAVTAAITAAFAVAATTAIAAAGEVDATTAITAAGEEAAPFIVDVRQARANTQAPRAASPRRGDGRALRALCLGRQVRQYTGETPLGRNGTCVSAPQSVQTAS